MIIWKGKGILIIVYFIVIFISIAITNRILIENFGLVQDTIPMISALGIALIGTGIWTKLTANSYYEDNNGEKVIMDDITNSFFFIKMNTWGIILPLIGVILTVYGFMVN